jgi:hypothetical protein
VTVTNAHHAQGKEAASDIHSNAAPCGSVHAIGIQFAESKKLPFADGAIARRAISGNIWGDSLEIQQWPRVVAFRAKFSLSLTDDKYASTAVWKITSVAFFGASSASRARSCRKSPRATRGLKSAAILIAALRLASRSVCSGQTNASSQQACASATYPGHQHPLTAPGYSEIAQIEVLKRFPGKIGRLMFIVPRVLKRRGAAKQQTTLRRQAAKLC